jgi:hypothetical protein
LCRVHLQNGVSRAQLPGTCMEPAESHSSSRKQLLMSQAKDRKVYCTGNIILICDTVYQLMRNTRLTNTN